MAFLDEVGLTEVWFQTKRYVNDVSSGTENLADNWCFFVPINQRGQTEYTGAGYTIDRWKFFEGGATLQIVPGGVKIIRPQTHNVAWGTLLEGYQRYAGKQVTVSFLTDQGLYSASVTLPTVKPQGEQYPLYHATEIGHVSIGVWDGLDGIAVFLNSDGAADLDVILVAAKIEIGSIQTLARQDDNGNWVLNDPPPDNGLEQIKCRMSKADPADTYANASALNMVHGTYTGNDATEREINLGFQPEFVMVDNIKALKASGSVNHVIRAMAGNSWCQTLGYFEDDPALEITSNGFKVFNKVYSSNDMGIANNISNNQYCYVAFY